MTSLFPGRTLVLALTLLLAGAAVACATGGGSGGEADEGGNRDRNLITESELAGMEDLNVHQAIRRLKPVWLRYRGQAVFEGPDREGMRVYVDGHLFGNADTLAQLRIRDVKEIRYLDGRRATLRFGTDHTVGAILVTTRRG